ncbi:MAG: putative dioxygenase of extradiol dioxygenase family [Osedax symbiont Rs1]|nr:MAG: putative dioxygenase of extradiol dioxygenase family [Osedax symbiont Rs1]
MHSIFHLAFNVTNLQQACDFYTNVLGCKQGRRAETWVDYNFFGHQLSLHIGAPFVAKSTGLVDGIKVPMPHFGAVLALPDWLILADQLRSKELNFVIEPCQRFAGQAGEQHTMFFLDPFGNPIELKGFSDLNKVFD